MLLADKSLSSIAPVTEILADAGLDVTTCTHGDEVLAQLQQTKTDGKPFDLCVLNVMLGDMNAYQLSRRIREQHGPEMPLLACSPSTPGTAKSCENAGFNGFLPKPVNRGKLLKMIRHLLSEAENRHAIATQHSVQEGAKQSIRILLAEDNPVNQKLAGTMLTKAGYSVTIAQNGREVIDLLTAAPEAFDIILMDIQMPEMNGLDATEQIRRMGFTDLPIIAVTANAMQGDREKCLAAGMNDYIAKPIKRDVIFSMLRTWVLEREEQPTPAS